MSLYPQLSREPQFIQAKTQKTFQEHRLELLKKLTTVSPDLHKEQKSYFPKRVHQRCFTPDFKNPKPILWCYKSNCTVLGIQQKHEVTLGELSTVLSWQ